jgi:hypothetical protein
MLNSVYLKLARPEYVSVPEGFLTALASEAFKVQYGVEPDSPQVLAVAYESRAAASGRRTRDLVFHQTRPSGDAIDKFGKALATAGLEADLDQNTLTTAVAGAIAGVRAKDGKVRASIPLTASLAHAQNLRGLANKRNPPDLGGILETFFQLGAPSGTDGEAGAAERWVSAVERRLAIDRVVRAVDAAISSCLFVAGPERIESRFLTATSDGFAGTPFSWFHRTWGTLCNPSWVDALPARVWVDWASTVLRLGFGMGYLWEVAWYELVARSVVGEGSETPDELQRMVGPLLHWKEQTASISVRDVSSSTKWRVLRSNGVRERIREWVESKPAFSDAEAELTAMRADVTLKRDLTDALSGPSGSNENLWEAINYALLTREGTGADADHYGFLRKQGRRFTVPDPGVEWIAAIASLSCSGPGGATDVGQLMRDLRELGLRPGLGELVSRLEQAGVARGSADADQAVAIEAAF